MILQQYKIVFGGSMGAGKSEAIRSISDIEVLTTEAFNTDSTAHEKMLTTVGIDYGEISLDDGVKVGLYGTPGQNRFDFMWSVICKGAVGIVILIDHNIAEPLADLEHYVNTFKAYGSNIAVGITHTDLTDAQSLTIYKQWMMQHHCDYPIFILDARIKQDVLLLIDAIIATSEVKMNVTA